ncbi:hypothetical protein O3P69_015052 [Scylla paramamosain]|uniref:NodB homology domain-containing protein n=1 Tax=Scylla paramamosain TaxID=85552 RepID=A0AAW0T2H1_SCYPA
MTRPLPCLLLLALLGIVAALAAPKSGLKDDASCKQGYNCKLPECLCPSLEAPGNFGSLDDVPQFVVLSYDDAVTVSNKDFYLGFQNLLNPNHCRISMTFFLSHQYTDYTIVNELHRLGHEIALHSVTHKSDSVGYWRPANESLWMQEMDDLRKMIVKFANIPEKDLKGWRAPFLELGGDEMFSALQQLGLKYDCSWTTIKYTNWFEKPNQGLWPYTLDYGSPQDCPMGRCPTDKYPGLWVMPMLDLNDNKNLPCAMLDTCQSEEDELLGNKDAVEAFLKRNFLINYYTNKAPFGLYTHHSWFYEGTLNKTEARREGYTNFLLWLSTLEDVYVVSLDRLLAWMKDPKPVDQIDNIPEITCPPLDPETTCPSHNTYYFGPENNIPPQMSSMYMTTCTKPKPPYYPWLYNPYGLEDIPIQE